MMSKTQWFSIGFSPCRMLWKIDVLTTWLMT